MLELFSSNLLLYSLGILLLMLYIKRYYESPDYKLKCKTSKSDNEKYCIRERDDELMDEGIELLSEVTSRCTKLVDYLKENHYDTSKVKRLCSNFNPRSIYETLPSSAMTAYSENKGEKIALCLNKDKNENGTTYIDINTLTYVVLHELAHLMTKSIGHKTEFWNNFKYLLKKSVKIGIYIPVDYSKHKQSYCGDTISDNPFYT
jgi:phosphopantetheine adenylyltransferase